ncbi:MAG: galactose mutarotase, partial [Polyangiaceae bacterium]
EDREARASLRVAPARGGMATHFSVAGREIFFLDPTTFEDETKNVRGGNPVLFPSPGKLEQDRWARSGEAGPVSGQLKQHGFARTSPWSIFSLSTDGAASVSIVLRSSSETLREFPWEFEATLRYRLLGPTLRIEQRVTSLSASGHGPMPFGFGFHPYFLVPDSLKSSASFETKAKRGFDNTKKSDVDIGAIHFAVPELDLHLYEHGSNEASLSWAGGEGIVVRAHPAYSHWVLWTLAGRDFVCVEPWTCPGNALNSGDRLIWLNEGESKELWVEISPTQNP